MVHHGILFFGVLINGVLLVLEKYVWGKYLDKLPRVLKHIYTLFIVVVMALQFLLLTIYQS